MLLFASALAVAPVRSTAEPGGSRPASGSAKPDECRDWPSRASPGPLGPCGRWALTAVAEIERTPTAAPDAIGRFEDLNTSMTIFRHKDADTVTDTWLIGGV